MGTASFPGDGALELSPISVITQASTRRRRAVNELLLTVTFVTTLPSGVILYNEGVSVWNMCFCDKKKKNFVIRNYGSLEKSESTVFMG